MKTYTKEEVEKIIAFDRGMKKAEYYQQVGNLDTLEQVLDFLYEMEQDEIDVDQLYEDSQEIFE